MFYHKFATFLDKIKNSIKYKEGVQVLSEWL